jgi:hypothetical protein
MQRKIRPRLVLAPAWVLPGAGWIPSLQEAVGSMDGVLEHRVLTEGHTLVLEMAFARSDVRSTATELSGVVAQCGFSLVNGIITEVVTYEVEAAVASALGGGVLGSQSNNVFVKLVALGLAALVGWKLGSALERVETTFELYPDALGRRWIVFPRDEPGGDARPGLAWT